MVCCRSRYPLRNGPLQRGNEVASVMDVDIDKQLVYVDVFAVCVRERHEAPRLFE